MEKTNFTRDAAAGHVGERIRSLADFSGVANGTEGEIVRSDGMGDGDDVVIRWTLPDQPFGAHVKPLEDWFAREEYERYLQRVER